VYGYKRFSAPFGPQFAAGIFLFAVHPISNAFDTIQNHGWDSTFDACQGGLSELLIIMVQCGGLQWHKRSSRSQYRYPSPVRAQSRFRCNLNVSRCDHRGPATYGNYDLRDVKATVNKLRVLLRGNWCIARFSDPVFVILPSITMVSYVCASIIQFVPQCLLSSFQFRERSS
jgi:hypothetical protein